MNNYYLENYYSIIRSYPNLNLDFPLIPNSNQVIAVIIHSNNLINFKS